MAQGTRYTGKVKTFNVSKGHGFIICPKIFEEYNQDVYVHIESLSRSCIDPASLLPGMLCAFDVNISPKGQPQANNIKIIAGGDGGSAGKGKVAKGLGKAGPAPPQGPPPKGKGGKPPGKHQGKQTAKGGGGVDAAKLLQAVQQAVGDIGSASVAGGFAQDGSPEIRVSLNTLNLLLRAGGFDAVEGCQDIPEEIPDVAEGLPGYDGEKVAGPWFVGTLKEYFPDSAYGFIESKTFKEQFGDKECFIHADHLDPDGTGDLMVKEGEEVIFPLVEDEESNAWAWAPIIPKTRTFLGTIKSWTGGWGAASRGVIKCDTLWPVFEEDIFCHGAAAEYGGIDTTPGASVLFELHVNKDGKPQASSPRLPGSPNPHATASPGFGQPPAKRPRVHVAISPQLQPQQGGGAVEGTWYTGIVKSFNDSKGFGFVDCADTHAIYGRDVFIYHQILTDSGADVGSTVQFEVMLNKSGHPQVKSCSL